MSVSRLDDFEDSHTLEMAKDTKSQKWLPKQWYKEKAEHATVQLFVKTSEKLKKKKVRVFSLKMTFLLFCSQCICGHSI